MSAASRIYVPTAMWARIRDRLVSEIESIRIGDVADFRNFMGAVIDRRAFPRSPATSVPPASVRSTARSSPAASSTSVRATIRPTLVEVADPQHRLMCEEIFGPVVTLHPYRTYEEALVQVDRTSPYASLGGVRPRSAGMIVKAMTGLQATPPATST